MLAQLRSATTALAVTGALGLAACGDDGQGGAETARRPASRSEAVKQIAAARTALTRGVAAVRAGDRRRADEILSEGYLRHFEEVEAPLEKVDAHLKEELEEALSTELRARIRRGAPVGEVERRARDIRADLDAAEGKLR